MILNKYFLENSSSPQNYKYPNKSHRQTLARNPALSHRPSWAARPISTQICSYPFHSQFGGLHQRSDRIGSQGFCSHFSFRDSCCCCGSRLLNVICVFATRSIISVHIPSVHSISNQNQRPFMNDTERLEFILRSEPLIAIRQQQ